MSEAHVRHLESSKLRSRSLHEMVAAGSQAVQARGQHLEKVDIPIQRGFASIPQCRAPMTVNKIAMKMMSAAQPMIWILAIGGLRILLHISRLLTGSTSETMRLCLSALVERIA